MKNLNTKHFAMALLLVGTSVASAFERETGGQHTVMITEYTCFNRAQLGDAPSVSILVDRAGYREVTVSNRGVSYAYGLTPVSNDESGTSLSGRNIEVFISGDANSATVTLNGLDLTYQCELKKP